MNSNRITAGFVILFICCFCSSSAFGQFAKQPLQQQLDNDLSIAYNLIRLGDFNRAIEFLDHLKSRYGENQQILSLYKNIYMDAKMYPKLEQTLLRQINRTPGNPLLLAELGNARFLQDDISGADSLWKLALEKGSQNQAVYIYVAGYKLRFGDYTGAADTYLLGREKFKIPDIFSPELANIYEAQRNYPAAVNEYLIRLIKTPKKFLSISPKILGMVKDSEEVDAIISTVKSKIKKHDKSYILREMLGDIYIKIGAMEKAFETYRRIGKGKNDDGESLYRLAERCFDFKAYATTAQAIDEYFSKSSKSRHKSRALLLKGKALRFDGRVDEALVLLDNLSIEGNDIMTRSEAGYISGEIYAELQNCDKAITTWNNASNISRDPVFKNKVAFKMAVCHFKEGSYQIAESLLTNVTESVRQDDIKQNALFLLGDLALFRGEYEKAKELYTDIIKQYSNGDFANNSIERLSIISSTGIDNSGITADNSILDRYADAVEAQLLEKYENAASILLEDKLISSAIGEQSIFYAGLIFIESENNAKAIETLKRYIEKYPEGYYIERAYLFLGDKYVINPETLDMAKEAYNQILQVFPEGPVTELARERLRRLEPQNKIG